MLLGERIVLDLDAQQRILRFALCRMLLVAEHPGAFPGKSASFLILMRSSASYQSASLLILMRSSASYQNAPFLILMRSSASYLS
jgi:hypothetical protein